MPQLDHSTYTSQIFWLSICFTMLYLFVQYFLFPSMLKIKHNRGNKIEKDLAKAEINNKKIVELELELQNIKKDLKITEKQLLDSVSRSCRESEKKKSEEFSNKISELENEVSKEIDSMKKEISNDLDDLVLKQAKLIIKNLYNKDIETNVLRNLKQNSENVF